MRSKSNSMKNLTQIVGMLGMLFGMACSGGQSVLQYPPTTDTQKISPEIITESAQLTKTQAKLQEAIEKSSPPPRDVKPLMPAYDPLEDQLISFSMLNENIQVIFYALSQATNMNFILDPQITTQNKQLTLNFDNVSAARVLKEITNTFDLYYEIDENVIRVQPYQERVFKLNFMDTNLKTSFEVGGDVLGAGSTETIKGLSGSFVLSGSGSKKGNSYDVVEDIVNRVKSKTGIYALNRLAGSLYIKDKPTVLRTLARQLDHFRVTLSRQIVIEAQIIEVILSDEYDYGIDWGALRDLEESARELTSVSWSLGTGLVMSGKFNKYSIAGTINALKQFGDLKVVSNPTIRSKHGKPSIISVGTSISYKKSVETTTIGSGVTTDRTTNIEVSTVFDGLILGVIPFIEENGNITLLVNPINSDVDEDSLEPVPTGGGGSISLPIVRIKEISTTISLNSGDIVILGGLIDKRKVTKNTGVPILSAIPVLGYLFRDEHYTDSNRELVIVLSVRQI
jgi:MSHA type pilus biogenesis protein MshL